MENVCPLCNGMNSKDIVCDICGNKMEDEGPIVNYFDDYSPYLSNDITQLLDGVPHDKCCHLYRCSKCNLDKRIEIDRVRM